MWSIYTITHYLTVQKQVSSPPSPFLQLYSKTVKHTHCKALFNDFNIFTELCNHHNLELKNFIPPKVSWTSLWDFALFPARLHYAIITLLSVLDFSMLCSSLKAILLYVIFFHRVKLAQCSQVPHAKNHILDSLHC